MNDFAKRQRKPTRWLVNLCVVVALHALLLWAIQSGLATRFVKTVKDPVQAMLLEEVQPVLPPPAPTVARSNTAPECAAAHLRSARGGAGEHAAARQRHCRCDEQATARDPALASACTGRHRAASATGAHSRRDCGGQL